jgi:hypothetical protein
MTFIEQILLAVPLALFSIGILEVYSRSLRHIHILIFKFGLYIISVALFIFLPIYGLHLSFEASSYNQNETHRFAVMLIWLAGLAIYMIGNRKALMLRLGKNH